jgi:CubicO group peptidase (beta-lactamase class C family)
VTALVLTLTLALSAAPAPERFDARLEAAFDAAVRHALARQSNGGVSVGVQQGSRRWTAAYGQRDLAKKLPATVDTTYRLASITKSFTAVAVNQLADAGKLSLDAEIQSLVPSYPKKQWPVTVRQLLGHLGGVPNYKSAADGKNLKKLDTSGAIALFADRPLAVEPGTEYHYTTWGYVLLGGAIEKASGVSYGDYLAKNVFGPSGMSSAALDDFATRGSLHATGYARKGGKLVPSDRLDVSSRSAGGGTRGSVLDLLGFGGALLENKLVPEQTAARMWVPMATREGKLTDYGMGFAAYPLQGHMTVAHSGAQPETSTLLMVLPDDDLVVALATNVEGEGSTLKAIANRVVELLEEDARPRRPVHALDAGDRVLAEGLNRLFSYGVGYHLARVEVPLSQNLAADFAEIEKLLSASAGELPAALEALRQGHEPRGRQVLLRVGMAMARTIEAEDGVQALRALRAEGGIAFFRAYRSAWSKAKASKGLSLASLDARVGALAEAVLRTAVPELARLRLDEVPKVETLWTKLEPVLVGAPVHPNHADELIDLSEQAARKGKAAEALAWLERAARTHPGSVTAQLACANALLADGKLDEGRARYRQAYELLAAVELKPDAALLELAQKVEGKKARAAAVEAATLAAAP